MKQLLIVVDMQNDFIDGSLGTPEAQAIVPNVIEKIQEWNGDILFTRDEHYSDYLTTNEGRHLPIKHCIVCTDGTNFHHDITNALVSNKKDYWVFTKETFGSIAIPKRINSRCYDRIELVGLCTDICVISNALILKAYYPETDIAVDVSCCAGSTPENHKAAIKVLKACQIDIIGE